MGSFAVLHQQLYEQSARKTCGTRSTAGRAIQSFESVFTALKELEQTRPPAISSW